MRRWVLGLLLVLLACSRDPHRAVVARAQAQAQRGEITAALGTVTEYLGEHPDARTVQRHQFVLLLKLDRLDAARQVLAAQPEPADWLATALRHPDLSIRAGAAQLACDAPQALPLRALVRGAQAVSAAHEVRRHCVRALGLRGDRRALKTLFRALHDPHWTVRAEAAEALGRIAYPASAGWLIVASTDSDGFVRYRVWRALQAVATEENHSLLRSALDRVRPRQRFAVALALAQLRDPLALGELLATTEHPDPDARQLAAEALGRYQGPAVERALQTLSNDAEPAVRQEALTALERLRKGDVVGTRD